MKGKNKFQSRDAQLSRKINLRDERPSAEALPKILFSCKDFDGAQIPPGQNYEEWQKEGLLAYMLQKFGHICALNVVEAQQQKVLKIYGNFPFDSDFKHPRHINEDVNWAVIMDVKGQKSRVAGHLIDNVFYVVFLDRDHLFYKTSKK